MMDALDRLDQTDTLVEQIFRNQAKMEHSASRGHVLSNHYMHRHPLESEVPTRVEPNHCPAHGAGSLSK